MALLAALLLLLVAASNYFLHRDVTYPGFLQAALWCAALFMLVLNADAFIPVANRVFILMTVGVVLFSMGAFVGSYGHTPHRERNYIRDGTLPSGRVVLGVAALALLGLVLYANRALTLALAGPSSNAFVNLRYAVSVAEAETGGFGLAAYFSAMANLLVGIIFLKRFAVSEGRSSLLAVAAAVLIALGFGVLSSGRGPILFTLVIIFATTTILRVTRPAVTASILLGLTLLLFAAVGVALGKGGTLGLSLVENLPTLRESFLTYALGGVPALGTTLTNPPVDVDLGLNTFRSVMKVLQVLGFNVTAPPLVQDYIDVPMPANVYTVYQPYIKDFGVVGGTSMLFVLGLIHGVLYRKATVRSPHALFVFLFAMSLFPLVMQVFQDMYFSLLSFWLQYAVYALLAFVVLAGRRHTDPRPTAIA